MESHAVSIDTATDELSRAASGVDDRVAVAARGILKTARPCSPQNPFHLFLTSVPFVPRIVLCRSTCFIERASYISIASLFFLISTCSRIPLFSQPRSRLFTHTLAVITSVRLIMAYTYMSTHFFMQPCSALTASRACGHAVWVGEELIGHRQQE